MPRGVYKRKKGVRVFVPPLAVEPEPAKKVETVMLVIRRDDILALLPVLAECPSGLAYDLQTQIIEQLIVEKD